jgi:nitroimidazol reductase NimA-like FMN-containing flavoprotein (pyridoxamine 5'-phosphate oxidase superfamily)
MVIPTIYGFDDRHLYLHGSVASQSLSAEAPACVTVTRAREARPRSAGGRELWQADCEIGLG